MAAVPIAASNRLLDRFQGLFQGRRYLHRSSNLADLVAMEFYEDLLLVRRSPKYVLRVQAGERVLSVANLSHGISARRGDGTFGEILPGEHAVFDPGYQVARGPIAAVEIAVEVKILNKAMLKQMNRVLTVLGDQVAHFRRRGATPLTLAVVGINFAARTTSYEGDRAFPTGTPGYPHPIQEAPEAERRIAAAVSQAYDEALILRYRATNEAPYPFEWVNEEATRRDYAAILARVSRDYERRF